MSRARRLALAALLTLAAAPALAHEALHEVARGRAVAVRALHDHDEGLANASYEVYSPADPRTPHQKGRTDRNGWLAFVPDAPGRWRIKVFDGGGHGLDVEVDAASATADPVPPAAGGALRPVAGALVIGAVFGALFLASRRKGRTS